MKTVIICLLLVFFIGTGHSQIVLDETWLDYSPASMKVDPVTNSVTLKITEAKVGEFQRDPIAFIQDKFDIHKFIAENQEYEFDGYNVYFKTNKGLVRARYDNEGEMLSTYQTFKDVALPDDIRLEILRDYRNSRVLKNRHIVASKGWMIDQEFYKVKIQDGDKVRRLKFNRKDQGISLVNN